MIGPMEAAVITASGAIIAVLLTQFVAEAYRRFRDGSALAAGLAGELMAYKDAFPILEAALKEWSTLQSGHEGLALRPMERPVDLYYKEAVGKIGVLGPDLVEDIVYVYANLNGFRIGLEMLTKSFKEMGPVEFRQRASSCYMLLNQAHTRASALLPRLDVRARKIFLSPSQKKLRYQKN